jgi:glutaredoxin-related protein
MDWRDITILEIFFREVSIISSQRCLSKFIQLHDKYVFAPLVPAENIQDISP